MWGRGVAQVRDWHLQKTRTPSSSNPLPGKKTTKDSIWDAIGIGKKPRTTCLTHIRLPTKKFGPDLTPSPTTPAAFPVFLHGRFYGKEIVTEWSTKRLAFSGSKTPPVNHRYSSPLDPRTLYINSVRILFMPQFSKTFVIQRVLLRRAWKEHTLSCVSGFHFSECRNVNVLSTT